MYRRSPWHTAFLVLGAITSGALWAQMVMQVPPPPPPPVGWEEKILPGFEPPIEYVLVYGEGCDSFFPSMPQIEALIARWGPEAGPALVQLHKHPDFDVYRDRILRFMLQVKTPEAADYLEERFEEALKVAKPDAQGIKSARERLEAWSTVAPEAADEALRAGLTAPESPFYDVYAQTLIRRTDHPRARALLAVLDLEALSEQTKQMLERSLPYLRAHEPLEAVSRRRGGKED